MTINKYVDEILEVPITRIGYKYMTLAIELVADDCTTPQNIYKDLSLQLDQGRDHIERSLRTVKDISLSSISDFTLKRIFQTTERTVPTREYIFRAGQYYRETDECELSNAALLQKGATA